MYACVYNTTAMFVLVLSYGDFMKLALLVSSDSLQGNIQQ